MTRWDPPALREEANYETRSFPLEEWSEIDCHLMEADGWEQDGPAKAGWIRYRRPFTNEVKGGNDQ